MPLPELPVEFDDVGGETPVDGNGISRPAQVAETAPVITNKAEAGKCAQSRGQDLVLQYCSTTSLCSSKSRWMEIHPKALLDSNRCWTVTLYRTLHCSTQGAAEKLKMLP